MKNQDVDFGFKRPTMANWLDVDFASSIQIQSAEVWFRALSEPQLQEEVPRDIHALLEVIRGAMLYGYLFYPLMSLATDQTYRLLEAAARLKCDSLGIATERTRADGQVVPATFGELIRKLVASGVIDAADEPMWRAGRHLRNLGSHATEQWIVNPGAALSALSIAIARINRLFGGPKGN